MSSTLRTYRATLDRIDSRLTDLKRKVRNYHRRACKIRYCDDLDRGERIYRLAKVQEPPDELSIDVTEIVCLMRAALDHLFYAMVTAAHGGTLGDPRLARKVHFPIPENPVPVDRLGKEKSAFRLRADQWDWVDRLNQCGTADPRERVLRVLSALTNTAKHRFHNGLTTVTPRSMNTINGKWSIWQDTWGMYTNMGNRRIIAYHSMPNPEFQEGAEIFRIVPDPVPATGPRTVTFSLEDFRAGRITGHDIALVSSGIVDRDNSGLLSAWLHKLLSAQGQPWSNAEWSAYFEDLRVEVKVAQLIQFGSGDLVTEGLPMVETLKSIFNYLRKDVCDDQGAFCGLS